MEERLAAHVSFTPDGKWVVFRSNMFGPTYAFAVEVAFRLWRIIKQDVLNAFYSSGPAGFA